MSKATPGPWFANDENEVWHDAGHCHQFVCETNAEVSIRGGDPAANARLIAAAPDLLKACKWALTNAIASRNHDSDTPYVASLRAAIAKATGE